MLKPSFAAAATAVLVTLAGGLFGAGEAHARAIYKGTFDPRGDVYGFAGTYQFAVDPACLITNGLKTVNGFGSNPCGNAVLIGGELTLRKYESDLKDTNGNYVNNTTLLNETFDFSKAENDWDKNLEWGDPLLGEKGGMQRYISRINVVNNELFGVDTPDRFGAFGKFDNLHFALEFFSGGTVGQPRSVKLLIDCDPSTFTPPPGSGTENTATCAPDPAPNSPLFVPLSTKVTIERVPEPGSLALVAAALMAAGLGRRLTRSR